DPRPKQKTQMPSLRRSGKPRRVHEADVTGPVAAAERNQALGDESAIEPNERHYVGNRPQCDIIEKAKQIRLRVLGPPKATLAQNAIDGDDGYESQSDSCQMTEAGEIVAPVRIDDCQRRRQFLIRLMVINNHHVESGRLGLRERLDTRRAAI